MGNTQALEVRLPRFELGAVSAREPDVIQTESVLIEVGRRTFAVEMVQTEKGPTHQPHDVSKRSGVFVDHRVAPDQRLVPRHTSVDVTDRQRDVMNSWKIWHDCPF